MFQGMSDRDREEFANEIRKWQDHILHREGVERRETVPGKSISDELPPGSAHAYGRMEWAYNHLTAPKAATSDLIENTHGGGQFFWHPSGCYNVYKTTKDLWAVSRYGGGSWNVVLERNGNYYLYSLGDKEARHVVNGNWLAVFATIAGRNL